MKPDFEESFDVIVVGYGFAGAIAALVAADAGARVLLAEKEATPGGISICSGGAMRSARDADEAFAYLKATNAGRTPDDVLRVLADGMAELEQDIRRLAEISDATVEAIAKEGNYPFPGVGTFYQTLVTSLPGLEHWKDIYPHVSATRSSHGWRFFKVLEDNIARRNIVLRYRFAAERLVSREGREVIGVTFKTGDGRRVAIKARCGVILACGGFEASEEMKRQYWQKAPVLSAVSTANTGDGIRMAMELGADLWHLWHYHGSYGFKHPDPNYPVAIRVKRLPDWFPGREHAATVKMSWIILDRDGRRYMNECTPYTQDTSHRPMELFDSVRQGFPRIPSYLIFDENGRKMYPVGMPTFNREELAFAWSKDNLREVEMGIIKKADSLAELARLLSVDTDVLQNSLDRWNDMCRRRHDEDFGRPPGTMALIDTPPFYVGEVWPVVSNTQGGPVHNARQQVMNVFGEPIPRLYAAGEMGSAFGYLYLSGGNLSECIVTGKVAGREAAKLAPWDSYQGLASAEK